MLATFFPNSIFHSLCFTLPLSLSYTQKEQKAIILYIFPAYYLGKSGKEKKKKNETKAKKKKGKKFEKDFHSIIFAANVYIDFECECQCCSCWSNSCC